MICIIAYSTISIKYEKIFGLGLHFYYPCDMRFETELLGQVFLVSVAHLSRSMMNMIYVKSEFCRWFVLFIYVRQVGLYVECNFGDILLCFSMLVRCHFPSPNTTCVTFY